MKLDDIFLYERRNFLLEQMFQLLRVEVSPSMQILYV